MCVCFRTPRRVRLPRTQRTLLAISILCAATPTWSQPRAVRDGEVLKLAPTIAPTICMARAFKKQGKVLIRISGREILLKKKDPSDQNAKDWVACWTETAPLVLGQEIRAYNTSRRKIDEATLLKVLAKPVAVACFQRTHKTDPELPDLLYTSAFRSDLVLLVFEAKYWLRK